MDMNFEDICKALLRKIVNNLVIIFMNVYTSGKIKLRIKTKFVKIKLNNSSQTIN